VLAWAAFPNVTVPGPLTTLHAVVTAAGGFGSPSSAALPASDAGPGTTTDWSAPAFTLGAWLAGGVLAPIRVAACKVTLPQALKL
jgi:hypothetical protein